MESEVQVFNTHWVTFCYWNILFHVVKNLVPKSALLPIWGFSKNLYYHQPMKLWEGNVFMKVLESVEFAGSPVCH